MSKYMPGPWFVEKDEKGWPRVIENQNEEQIAVLSSALALHQCLGGTARLIAVTPDLLEAVIKAAIPLEAIYASVHWELAEELKDAVVDAVLAIRKVIAKIEEESP